MRKPPEIASTRGKEQSFLDIVFEHKNADRLAQYSWSREQLSQDQQQLFLESMGAIDIMSCSEDGLNVISSLSKHFTHEQEYGLLNRLDTVTSGLLYFAKTPDVYTQRKQRQADSRSEKYYLASTWQKIEEQVITTPLWHHTNGKKMIVADDNLLSSRRKQKIKWWHILEASTEILDHSQGFTKVRIYKWRRHQIRAHLAHIGHPIIGETLYDDTDNPPVDGNEKHLQLYSIGCKIT